MNMAEIMELGDKYFMDTYSRYPVVLDHGKGAYLYDTNGKEYVDFTAGIAVNSLGYGSARLIESIKKQLDKLFHCSNLYYNEPAVKLAELLAENSGLDRVFFCNSGAEAIEAALKLARKYGEKYFGIKKYEIITMKNSFHGRTYGAISATGQIKYQKHLSPLLPGIKYADYNDYQSVMELVTDTTCAIVMEVIQGEGGIIPADPDFIRKIRQLCDERGIMLIFDEVQTGIGRTGYLFGYEYFGVVPDAIALAKGLGGGMPIGALLAKEKYAAAFEPGDHASTFGGNPLACIAGLAVLYELLENGVLDNVKKAGSYLGSRLEELGRIHECIVDIRGIGLMRGISITGKNTADIIAGCLKAGLLLTRAGSDTIRFVPPLIIDERTINRGVSILDSVLGV